MSLLVANPNFVQQHRPYQAGLFVNRQDEIDKIKEKIRLIQSEQSVSHSVINYWGIEGIGKSWLLHYLKDKFSYINNDKEKYPAFTTLFDFREIEGENELVRFAKDLSDQIFDQLLTNIPTQIRPR